MAIDCDELSARAMDLIYGEVPADVRAALEAHVAGCARCQAELAGLTATRATARRSLDADPPPARAHQAILQAAAAAVAAKQPAPLPARQAGARPSLWQRLRVRWTLPTFATIGAVAVVVLASKLFLEPDKTVDLGRQTVNEGLSQPAAPPAGTAAAPAPVANGEAPPEREENEALPSDTPKRSSAPAVVRRRRAGAENVQGLAKKKARGGVARGQSALGDLGEEAAAPASAPSASAAPASPAPSLAGRAFAPPPPARASAPASDGIGTAKAERGDEGFGAGPSPVARADRLFTERRWAEAARAYRALLRRDPRNVDAARWRQRLSAAEAALTPAGP